MDRTIDPTSPETTVDRSIAAERPLTRMQATPWLLVILLIAAVAWLGWRAFFYQEEGDPVGSAMLAFEKQRQMLGCADAGCMAEIGGALGEQCVLGFTYGQTGNYGNFFIAYAGGYEVKRGVKADAPVFGAIRQGQRNGKAAKAIIEQDIRAVLEAAGVAPVTVSTRLAPAWTTDWISEEGRQKLRLYGIAPPVNEPDKSALFSEPPRVACPKCNSKETRMVSLFGSTACKAQYQCNQCLEPFDYFKCLK